MRKQNCWEFKKCGREPRGISSKEFGVCPASIETKLHGVHDGWNAGRACWIVSGSLCDGCIQGTYAEKYGDCKKCDFYNFVKKEENSKFKLSQTLLMILREDRPKKEKKKAVVLK